MKKLSKILSCLVLLTVMTTTVKGSIIDTTKSYCTVLIDTPPPPKNNLYNLPENIVDNDIICEFPIVKMPQYIGGDSARERYINDKLNIIDYKKYNILFPRKVFVKFTIDKSGKPKNPKIWKGGIDSVFNNLIVKVVNEMPNWEPGEEKEEPIEVDVVMPIKFSRKED